MTLLSNSYKRYKADTTAFTNWLSDTAVRCGWKPPTSTPLKSSTKRNGAAAEAKYAVTTRDLVQQAEVIAAFTKPRVQIPSAVVTIINRCISARERCAAWYDSTESAANDGHAYFITTLKEIVRVLSPCVIVKRTAARNDTEQQPANNAADEKQPSSYKNIFEALPVEDVAELLDCASCDSKPAKSKKISEVSASYDALASENAERAFDVYCFLEDLQNTQKYIESLWDRYQSQDIDIITASTVTNAALELVRRAEWDFFQSMRINIPEQGSFAAILSIIFRNNDMFTRLKAPITPEHATLCFSDSFDQFLRLSTARTLLKWLDKTDNVAYYPWQIPRLSFDCLFQSALQQRAEVRGAEKRDTLLIQLLMDTRLIAERHGHLPSAQDAGESTKSKADMFCQAEQYMWQTRQLSIWALYTCHILVTIIQKLGQGVQHAYDDICRRYSQIEATVDYDSILKSLNEPRYHSSWKTKFLTILDETKSMIKVGREGPKIFEHYRQRVLSTSLTVTYFSDAGLTSLYQMAADGLLIQPHEDSTFVISHNLLNVGLSLLMAYTYLEDIGIILGNYNLALVGVAHLYNAARQLHLVDQDWPDLDRLINGNMRVLFGSELPTDMRSIVSRYMRKIGLSSSQIKATERRGAIPAYKPISKLPQDLYITSDGTIWAFRDVMREQISWEQWLYKVNQLILPQWQKGTSKHTWRLQPLVFLPRLEEHMQTISNKLQTLEYLVMARKCEKILSLVRTMIEYHCVKPWPPQLLASENGQKIIGRLDVMQVILIDCLRQESAWPDAPGCSRESIGAGSECMQIAAEVLNKYLKTQRKPASTSGSSAQ